GFVTGFAQDPVDDGLLGVLGVGVAERVRGDVVLAPHLAGVVGERARAFGDLRVNGRGGRGGGHDARLRKRVRGRRGGGLGRGRWRGGKQRRGMAGRRRGGPSR